METYASFKPTQFDLHYHVNNRENWLLAPVSKNRDSDCLARSNWQSFIAMLGNESEETYEIHRFGHWGNGWFEIILINPNNEKLIIIGNEIESALADYPVINEQDFSEMEMNEANEVWKNCYNPHDRINYIRKNRSQFDFHDFSDLWNCVKGEYFSGYASELIN